VKRILLVGAGHAHARLLAGLAREPLYGAALTLVSPYRKELYSGMLPGVVAGHYRRDEAQFDVAALAGRAQAEWIPASVTIFDPVNRRAILHDGSTVGFDFASLNAGSLTDTSVPGAADHALPVKPFERLLEKLRSAGHVAIAGGGASGAELAMALRRAGREVTLYSEAPAFPAPLAQRIARLLRRRGVDFRPGMRVDALEPGPVVVAGASRQQFDLVLWAAGAAPLPWLRGRGLGLDSAGFVRVDGALRSLSHPHVFAAGDCASLDEPKSGVHSVRHGEVLEANLRAVVAGQPLTPYRRRPRALMLLSCGSRYAIAARGDWIAQGHWVWWWKNFIDRRWIATLTRPPAKKR